MLRINPYTEVADRNTLLVSIIEQTIMHLVICRNHTPQNKEYLLAEARQLMTIYLN